MYGGKKGTKTNINCSCKINSTSAGNVHVLKQTMNHSNLSSHGGGVSVLYSKVRFWMHFKSL